MTGPGLRLGPLLLSGPHDAVVRSVTDGDTFRADIRVGALMLANETLALWAENRPVRLLGCNAAERATEAGKAAKANMTALLPVGTRITLTQVDGYKYGGDSEVVAAVILSGRDMIADLIAANWLAAWDGKGARPVPPWPRPGT